MTEHQIKIAKMLLMGLGIEPTPENMQRNLRQFIKDKRRQGRKKNERNPASY